MKPEFPNDDVYGKTHPLILKIDQVAHWFQCSPAMIYQMIAEGRLRAIRLGKGQGGLRVRREAAEEFLQQQERGGTGKATVKPLKNLTLE